MYAAADFVIDGKIKNLTSTCITFSHRNPRQRKKKPTRVQVQSASYESESYPTLVITDNSDIACDARF